MLGHGVGILPVDLFCGEFHIDHGGLNLAMTHEVHQRRQAPPLHSMSRVKLSAVVLTRCAGIRLSATFFARFRWCWESSTSLSFGEVFRYRCSP